MFSLQHQNTMNVTPRLFECENLYQQQRLMASTSSFGNQFRGNQPNSNDSSYANIFSRVSTLKEIKTNKITLLVKPKTK